MKLKPCPFCGGLPEVPHIDEIYGTHFEIEQCCYLTLYSIQIVDLLTREERTQPIGYYDQETALYSREARQRAIDTFLEEWNTRHSAWIPVSEQLPDVGITGVYASAWVLAYITYGDNQHEIDLAKYIKTNAHEDWKDTSGNNIKVTHWQPLPEPPNGD